MLINIVYLLIALILIYVIYIAVKAINTGMEAKKLYKPKSDEDLLENDFSENNTQNISDEILKLDGLLKSGVITKEEFEQAKKKLLKD
ncbi:MAG: SHOCT domain-containing protein [Candidatus Pelagibacter sp.]|nr:MAG: SHOCT domain-containing protein [Pelagibacterales bacterium]|tara:strand:+ start:531 stop:794 length:264 start_codon:yes stop_codon:yes gene_type:complete